MSRIYKFHNKEGIYFISFATVFWVDVFVRRIYFDCIVENDYEYLYSSARDNAEIKGLVNIEKI